MASMSTPFADILRAAVESTPGAIGGAFAASDGEMVDFVATSDPVEWALITAHYGVVMSHVQSALATCHFGEAQSVVIQHTGLEVLMYAVEEGYYALMAVVPPVPLAAALGAMDVAVLALREEMG